MLLSRRLQGMIMSLLIMLPSQQSQGMSTLVRRRATTRLRPALLATMSPGMRATV